MIKILFLHGLFSNGNQSIKAHVIKALGYKVYAPNLSNWWFNSAFKTAKQAVEEFEPDAIVGSSRGGAIAMQLESDKPLILLAPAWKHYKVNTKITTPCRVIHSLNDDMVPFEDSIELVHKNPEIELIPVESDHRLNSLKAQMALDDALFELVDEKITQLA